MAVVVMVVAAAAMAAVALWLLWVLWRLGMCQYLSVYVSLCTYIQKRVRMRVFNDIYDSCTLAHV